MIPQAAHLSETFGLHLHLPCLWVMKAAWHSELGQAREAMVNMKTQGNRVSQWDYGGRTEDGVRVHAALASVTLRNAFHAVPVPQFV